MADIGAVKGWHAIAQTALLEKPLLTLNHGASAQGVPSNLLITNLKEEQQQTKIHPCCCSFDYSICWLELKEEKIPACRQRFFFFSTKRRRQQVAAASYCLLLLLSYRFILKLKEEKRALPWKISCFFFFSGKR
ncbi:MAG: hypothetical protein ACQCN4_08750 [Candidatus Bathyarchaeia archaeon]